jgi:8-oxo-dGTP diphosphatase
MAANSVAICILYREGQLLMQLRDDIPTILYPGIWGLFGGHIEADETPEVAVVREIAEEIGYALPAGFRKFGIYADEKVYRNIFYAPLTVPIDQLNLSEGWDLGLLSLAEIKAGEAYSAQAGANKAIGPVHRQILLDFAQGNPGLVSE